MPADAEEVGGDGDDDVVAAAEDYTVERAKVGAKVDKDDLGLYFFRSLQYRSVDGGSCA